MKDQETADAAAAAALAHAAHDHHQEAHDTATSLQPPRSPSSPEPAISQGAARASVDASKRRSIMNDKQELEAKRQSQSPAAAAAAAAAIRSSGVAAGAASSPASPSSSPAAAAAAAPASGAPLGLDVDKSQPKDFEGNVETTNELPSAETLSKVENSIVLDRYGKSHTFKSLYTGPNIARRVLVIFIRHFFCGNCQEYLRSLNDAITPESLLQLPVSTSIVVIGCGDPALIEMYAEATSCPFPLYTDPTRSLFDSFGMVKTLALGSRPAYMKKGIIRGSISSIIQGLKQIPKGLALKSGDSRQVGGEFLFEPIDIVTPVSTPQDGDSKQLGLIDEPGLQTDDRAEEKRVTWCHRMKNTRDHAEVPELIEILGLDKQEPVTSRKGNGVSLAAQMNELSVGAEGTTAPVAAVETNAAPVETLQAKETVETTAIEDATDVAHKAETKQTLETTDAAHTTEPVASTVTTVPS